MFIVILRFLSFDVATLQKVAARIIAMGAAFFF